MLQDVNSHYTILNNKGFKLHNELAGNNSNQFNSWLCKIANKPTLENVYIYTYPNACVLA